MKDSKSSKTGPNRKIRLAVGIAGATLLLLLAVMVYQANTTRIAQDSTTDTMSNEFREPQGGTAHE